ncbi:hypothetical protein HOY80DRAFT_1001612 [Tuber brumale]|nr:hypothetical protein HOY80DRAFT_1001612 [Tuber brumale]
MGTRMETGMRMRMRMGIGMEVRDGDGDGGWDGGWDGGGDGDGGGDRGIAALPHGQGDLPSTNGLTSGGGGAGVQEGLGVGSGLGVRNWRERGQLELGEQGQVGLVGIESTLGLSPCHFSEMGSVIVLVDIYSSITVSYTINTLNQGGSNHYAYEINVPMRAYTRYVNGFVHISKLRIGSLKGSYGLP